MLRSAAPAHGLSVDTPTNDDRTRPAAAPGGPGRWCLSWEWGLCAAAQGSGLARHGEESCRLGWLPLYLQPWGPFLGVLCVVRPPQNPKPRQHAARQLPTVLRARRPRDVRLCVACAELSRRLPKSVDYRIFFCPGKVQVPANRESGRGPGTREPADGAQLGDELKRRPLGDELKVKNGSSNLAALHGPAEQRPHALGAFRSSSEISMPRLH
jgi:hypothetical protein